MTIRPAIKIGCALVCSLWAFLAAGCGSGSAVGPGLGSGLGTNPAPQPNPSPGALSLAQDLQPLLTARCAFVGCHAGSSAQAGQDLSAGNAYGHLVDVESSEVPGRKRVKPGDPDASFLVEKISQPNPSVGSRMPLGATPLTADEILMIRNWIQQGANP